MLSVSTGFFMRLQKFWVIYWYHAVVAVVCGCFISRW